MGESSGAALVTVLMHMNLHTRHPIFEARRWLMFLLDLLYPLRCGGCEEAGKGVWCESCDARVQLLYAPLLTCPLVLPTHRQPAAIDVTSAAVYSTPLREAIHALKYDGVPALAGPLSQYLVDAWRRSSLQADSIVPVPLHSRRRRERGYNQSELLARQLGREVGVPVEPRSLRRVRYTGQQARLNAAERRQNVKGAFEAERALSRGRHIVLVDDVFTTGATMSECAEALLDAGAASVAAITLARAG